MADKTEFLQAIDDAILDADSLERFINGDDTQDVLTRLSKRYPTLQKALKELFENGGLPATPFKTKAEMESSSLVDGTYAFVTDDDNNAGVYVRDGGKWIYSNVNGSLRPFELKDSLNIFNHNGYIKGLIASGTWGQLLETLPGTLNGRVAIMPVQPSTDYYLYSVNPESHDRFRVVEFSEYPEYGDSGSVVSSNDSVREMQFKTLSTSKWLAVYPSSDGGEPKVSLTEGADKKPFKSSKVISVDSMESPDLENINFKRGRSRNLFDGTYRDDIQVYAVGAIHTPKADLVVGAVENPGRKTIVLPIKEGRKYSVKIFDMLPNEFAWALTTAGYPRAGQKVSNHVQYVNNINGTSRFDFVAAKGATHLVVFASTFGKEYNVNILEGEMSEKYIPPYSAITEDLQKPDIVADSVLVKSYNLYNPEPVRAYVKALPADESKGERFCLVADPDLNNGKVCYLIPVGLIRAASLAYLDSRKPTSASMYKSNMHPTIVNSEIDGESIPEGFYLTDKQTLDTSGVYTHINFEQVQGYLIVEIDAIDLGEYSPKMVISEGHDSKPYTHPFEVDKRLLNKNPVDDGDVSNPFQLPIYNWTTDLSGYYRHTGDIPKNTDGTTDKRNMTQMFGDLLDLVSNSNGYLSMAEVGRADGGLPFYVIESNPARAYQHPGQRVPNVITSSSKLFKTPKIVMTAGVHGTESEPVLGVYQMLKILSENSDLDPRLQFIRRNIKLVIMPLVSPSAYRKTYYNVNGINVNRDFLPDGEAQASETNLVMQVLRDNADADYYFDYHSSVSEGVTGYTIGNNVELAYMANEIFSEMGSYLQKEHGSFPQDINFSWGFNTPTIKTTTIDFAERVVGINSCLMELNFNLAYWWDGDTDSGIDMNNRRFIELPINMILGCARNIQYKSRSRLM